MEWKSTVKKINELKECGNPFLVHLQQLEKVSADAYDQIFIDALLSTDYEFYDETDKCELYAKKAIAGIEDYVKSTVLSTRELVYLVDLLEKCYLNLLKHDLIEPKRISQGALIKNIRSSGYQLFFFFISRGSIGFENLILAVKFMNMRLVDHLKELFGAVFTFYDPGLADVIVKKIQAIYLDDTDFRSNANNRNSEIYEELMINFLVLDNGDHDYYIENVRNILISKKNNLEDLHRIFLNCLKINKPKLIEKVLLGFLKCKEVLTSSEATSLKALLTEYAKMGNSIDHSWLNFVDREDYVKFLFHKKIYAKIIEMYEKDGAISPDYAFCSYIELGRVEKAQKLFEMEQASKYGFDCQERPPLSEEYVFRLHLKANNRPAACNVLQSIKKVEDFIDYIQNIYAENDLKLLIEAVYIGLEKFKTSDFKMLQVFISLLHIEKLDIFIFDRTAMILKMIKILDFANLSAAQQEWIRTVCFNNVLDLIDLKCDVIVDLTNTMVMFDLDIDSIYLCLCVYSRKDINTKEHAEQIKKLYMAFTAHEKPDADENYYKAIVLFYKCYCIMEDVFAEDIFNLLLPFKKLNDGTVSLLLNVEAEIVNKLFDRKISVINEGEKRNLLDSDIIYAFITNLSIQGPHVSVLFLEKLILYVETKHLRHGTIVKIIANQKSLLEMIGDKGSVNRINLILEKIES
jgi:tetratricopeptide (TPR) repeat protein